jgi:hypothetical protein
MNPILNKINIDLDNDSRMSSVTIDDNLEAGKKDETNLSTPLKGILKKTCDYSEEKILFYSKLIKICKSILLLIISFPIIFFDIYYGYSNESCINANPKKINVSLKLYLLVSGFTGILLVLTSILIICMDFQISEYFNDRISRINELELIRLKKFLKEFKKSCKYVVGMFCLLWNIIGSVLFWSYYYENYLCSIDISTYIFITLLIKLLASGIYLYHKL